MNMTFLEKVTSHLGYLITDYGFFIKKVETSERSPETEGRVELETSATFVTVSGERWSVYVSVGRVEDDKYRFFLDLATIHEYVTLTEDEKKLMYSLDPKDDRKARRIIQQVRLLHRATTTENSLEDLNSQLANYAVWLRRYADSFLRGDFSQWLAIYEYKVARNRAAYLRSGKEEFVRTVGESGDKNESVFRNSLEYLDRLRNQYR